MSSPIRVLLVAPYEQPGLGGGQARAGRLLADVLVQDPGLDFHQVIVPHHRETKGAFQRFRRRIRFWGEYLGALVRHRPTLIHFFSPCHFSGFVEKSLLAWIGRITGGRTILSFRNDPWVMIGNMSPAGRKLFRVLVGGFDAAICQYNGLRGFFSRESKVREDRVFVVPNSIPVREVVLDEEGLRSRFEKGNLLFLGSLQKRKGAHVLIQAMGKLHSCPDFQRKADIVGPTDSPGYAQELRDQTSLEGLEGSIIFHGPKFGKEKDELLTSVALMVLPSRSEGYPNVVLEALQFGVPVVLGNSGAAEDIAKDFGSGVIVVDPDDHEGVARAVQEHLGGWGEYREKSRRCMEICRSFSPQEMGRRVSDSYCQILGRR